MVILNPLPGQEGLNTKILTAKGMAVMAHDEHDAVQIIEQLLNNPGRIKKMRKAIKVNAKPHSAIDIAKLLLRLAS